MHVVECVVYACRGVDLFVLILTATLCHFLFFSRYLCFFLNEFSQYAEITKMTVGNIAIVIGPNLLWPIEDSLDPGYVYKNC